LSRRCSQGAELSPAFFLFLKDFLLCRPRQGLLGVNLERDTESDGAGAVAHVSGCGALFFAPAWTELAQFASEQQAAEADAGAAADWRNLTGSFMQQRGYRMQSPGVALCASAQSPPSSQQTPRVVSGAALVAHLRALPAEARTCPVAG